MIFKRVGDGRPYPEHGLSQRAWAAVPPRQVRLDELVTTKDTLQLAALLDEDSTFYGDLFAHVVEWHDDLYLEDGLHRALRAALVEEKNASIRSALFDLLHAAEQNRDIPSLILGPAGRPGAPEPAEGFFDALF